MSGSEEDPYSTIFSSLKHPTRRHVLRSLSGGPPKRFSELQTELEVDSPSLSYHLDALRAMIAKDGEKYSLTELGRAALNLMRRVEETQNKPSARKLDLTHLAIAWIMVFLLLGFGIASVGFTTTFDNPAIRWLYTTHAYNVQPGVETQFMVEIKYNSNLISTLPNGEFVGGIERPSSTPWSSSMNYASFSVFFRNGTIKHWLTDPNGQLAPDRSIGSNQYSVFTTSIESSTAQESTFYTEMVDEGNYSLHMQNAGQGLASGNVTLGPSRVVYSKPFFFIGVLFLVPALAFIGVTSFRLVGSRFLNRQRGKRNSMIN